MSITPRRRAAFVAPLVLLGAVLSGCGVADGDDIRQGVAATVDGVDVSTSDVDRLSDGTCQYLATSEDTVAYPRVTVRRLYLETLVRTQAAKSLVDELDATLPEAYDGVLTDIATSYPTLPEDVAEDQREADRASAYLYYAASAIGDALAREETGAEPDASTDNNPRGVQAITDWLADHDVELNPTFGLEVRDGAFSAADDLSVAASDEAVAVLSAGNIDIVGSDTEEEQAALRTQITQVVNSLPADQVCGTPDAPDTPLP